MESKKYCVFNKTTERFLSAGVTSLSTKKEPLEALKMMVDAEDLNVESGIWLTPFKGIPVARIFSPVDLVYLDEHYRVLHAAELYPGVALTPFEGQAASALVLPLHTIYTSQTNSGDQLIICFAEELVRQLTRVSTSMAPAPVARRAALPAKKSRSTAASVSSASSSRTVQRPGSVNAAPVSKRAEAMLEQPQSMGGITPPVPDARKLLQEVQSQPPSQKAPNELQAREIDSVISQVLRWAEETERPLTPATASSAKPAVALNVELPPETPGGAPGAAPPASGAVYHPVMRPAGAEKPEIEEEAGTWTEQDATVLSQSVRWVEDAKPRLASTPLAPSTAAQSSEINSQNPRRESGAAPAVPGDRSAATRAATRPLNAGETVESLGEKKGPLKVGHQRLAEQAEPPLRNTPASTRLGPVSQSTESRPQTTRAEQAGAEAARQKQAAAQKLEPREKPASRAKQKDSLQNRFMRWLYAEPVHGPVDRRRSSRHRAPGLIAYYYTGGAPKPHKIGDISATGFYLVTEERWLPDTMIRMTLQRAGSEGENPEDAISVVSRIIRYGSDGVGSEFILPESTHPKSHQIMSGAETDRETLERFLHASSSARR